MSHKIEVEEVMNRKYRSLIATSSGKGSHKSLYLVSTCKVEGVTSHYVVEEYGMKVLVTIDLEHAVQTYNNLP